MITEEWYLAYQNWWRKRHNFEIQKDWLIFCTGVVPAISSIVRKMTTVGENVAVMTPVYNIFFNSILNNGRKFAEGFIEKEIPGVKGVKGEATYLLWMECRGIPGNRFEPCRFIREDSGLYPNLPKLLYIGFKPNPKSPLLFTPTPSV